MWAEFTVNQKDPNANMTTLQNKWLTDLDAFIDKHPKCTDTSEALLQLGMYQEFMGKSDDAVKRYQRLTKDFPNSRPAQKGAGALTRLNSLNKPMRLAGKDIQANANVDISSKQYRGKPVLIQYWATWCQPCKADMVLLKDYYDKHAGKDFDIISVCLDENAAAAKQFWAQNKYAWKSIYEPGGLDGRLANEMGVMTLAAHDPCRSKGQRSERQHPCRRIGLGTGKTYKAGRWRRHSQCAEDRRRRRAKRRRGLSSI